MRNFKRIILSVFSIFLVLSCSDDDEVTTSACDFNITIDEERYLAPSPSVYNVSNAKINGDCLEITIQASGCSGDSWEIGLFSNYAITNGFTTYVAFSLKLKNLELCEAYLTKTYSFDLSETIGNTTDTHISVDGWNDVLQITN